MDSPTARYLRWPSAKGQVRMSVTFYLTHVYLLKKGHSIELQILHTNLRDLRLSKLNLLT